MVAGTKVSDQQEAEAFWWLPGPYNEQMYP